MEAMGMNATAATRIAFVQILVVLVSVGSSISSSTVSSTGGPLAPAAFAALLHGGGLGGVAMTAKPLDPFCFAIWIAILRLASTDKGLTGSCCTRRVHSSARASAVASASAVVRRRFAAETSTLAIAARPTARGRKR